MATGNGAIIVHSHLNKHLSNYRITPYSAKYEYLALLIRQFLYKYADIIHASPEYGVFQAQFALIGPETSK